MQLPGAAVAEIPQGGKQPLRLGQDLHRLAGIQQGAGLLIGLLLRLQLAELLLAAFLERGGISPALQRSQQADRLGQAFGLLPVRQRRRFGIQRVFPAFLRLVRAMAAPLFAVPVGAEGLEALRRL